MASGIAYLDLATNRMSVPTTIQYVGVVTGADTCVATPSPALTVLTAGMFYIWKAAANNATTTPTLNISGLGAKTIVKRATTALAVADILANMFCMAIYNGTQMELINPVVN